MIILIAGAMVVPFLLIWNLKGRLDAMEKKQREVKGISTGFAHELEMARRQLQMLTQYRQQYEAQYRQDMQAMDNLLNELRFFSSCAEGILGRLELVLKASRNFVRDVSVPPAITAVPKKPSIGRDRAAEGDLPPARPSMVA